MMQEPMFISIYMDSTSTNQPRMSGEEDFPQEFRQFISTLPKQAAFHSVSGHVYRYQGFWHSLSFLHAIVSCQKHFLSQNDDVFLVSIPKSGTTWLKALLFSLLHRSRHHPTVDNHPLTTANPHDLIPYLEVNLYADNQIPDFSSYASPRLFATHLPHVSLPESVTENPNCKIIYLCRNPKDIFVSLWHFISNFKLPGEENNLKTAFEKFCRGEILFGPWWDHVMGYWKQHVENPDRVLFLKYEELRENPGVQLRRLSEFLGCPFSAAEEEAGLPEEILRLCSFDSLSGMEVNRKGRLSTGLESKIFFRRGVVGDWKNYLDEEMSRKFDVIAEEKFRGSGLML